jgi:hypothetical protein
MNATFQSLKNRAAELEVVSDALQRRRQVADRTTVISALLERSSVGTIEKWEFTDIGLDTHPLIKINGA